MILPYGMRIPAALRRPTSALCSHLGLSSNNNNFTNNSNHHHNNILFHLRQFSNADRHWLLRGLRIDRISIYG